MSETVCVKGVVETVLTDDHFANVGKMVDGGTEATLSKAVVKAYRRAKRASVAENMRAHGIVCVLRAKREGITEEPDIPNTPPTSTGGQASIFDF